MLHTPEELVLTRGVDFEGVIRNEGLDVELDNRWGLDVSNVDKNEWACFEV